MEFKRLSDVEMVEKPSEYANMLIEEDGIIKKTTMPTFDTSTMTDEFDVVFYINQNTDNITLQKGDLATVVQKMRNYKPIKSCLLCHWSGGSPAMYYMYQNGIISTPFYVFEDDGDDTDAYLSFMFLIHGGSYQVNWYPDSVDAHYNQE